MAEPERPPPPRDSVEWEGRSLLKALIKKSALRGEQVHVLGCEVSEEEFREGFDSSINSQLVYHDLFRDPLNWSKTGEALPGGPLGVLRAMCSRTGPGPVTIALDSLSWLLLHLPCTTVCQTLHALSHQDSRPDSRLSCAVVSARLPATSSMNQMLTMTWTKRTQMMT
ncbi:elongator acetyltransferase complex subunit 5 [Phyllostomus discolor]|uniref:Elongator complex protein 5 n=1 Tax=Phyllostomus discolor TaxID=89673 RepID=A0A834DUT7_9CHIR|nr:elongator acetyltransferase complex subunit 5 [Phyllostomus discolor]